MENGETAVTIQGFQRRIPPARCPHEHMTTLMEQALPRTFSTFLLTEAQHRSAEGEGRSDLPA